MGMTGVAHKYDGLSTDPKPQGVSAWSVFKEIDTGDEYEYDGSAWRLTHKAGARHVSDQSIHAGDRRPNSTTESYKSVSENWTYTRVDLSNNSTTVYAGPAVLGNIYVDTALSAQACPVVDGLTTVFSLPASLAAGTKFDAMKGTEFLTSLVINPDDSATGVIVVQWRKL